MTVISVVPRRTVKHPGKVQQLAQRVIAESKTMQSRETRSINLDFEDGATHDRFIFLSSAVQRRPGYDNSGIRIDTLSTDTCEIVEGRETRSICIDLEKSTAIGCSSENRGAVKHAADTEEFSFWECSGATAPEALVECCEIAPIKTTFEYGPLTIRRTANWSNPV